MKRYRAWLLVLAALLETSASAAVFAPRVSKDDVPGLLSTTAFVRGLDEAALAALVPKQSGLFFVGCPNCSRGRQENQLAWAPEHPDEVYCRYCAHRYPSETYPMNAALVVRNPRGEAQRYSYWESPQGYRYFFRARRDDLVREYLEAQTRDLALLYVATGDRSQARRAALLLDRFAQVLPGWCYHYDYPFRQKEVYEGDVPPAKFRANFRTARWTWWAFKDIPLDLVQAYDWIRESGAFDEIAPQKGAEVAGRIEHDLFRNAAEQVLANQEDFGNMSPYAWRCLVTVGRVIGEPRYVHEVVRRLREFVGTRFFYDGSWHEGSPSYASQTLGGLSSVLSVLRGYSDPPDYKDPDGTRFDNLDLATEFPVLQRARTALAKMRLPDGRPVPVHDTWATSRGRGALAATEPYLLPALGHACLGGGAGAEQTQFHLTWSGGSGHQHADNLSLLVFAKGRELLSDLGYTHTRYRSWTLATAAHNTVVIDGQNQALDHRGPPTDGSLRFYDARDCRVQVVSAEGNRGYPVWAQTYRRTLIVVDAGDDQRYAVDVFEVAGGQTHDYFLHGDANSPTSVLTALKCEALETLLPPGFDWKPTKNEGEAMRIAEPYYAYGFLRNLKAAPAPAGGALPVTFRAAGGSGPAVRITLVPEADSKLVVGENPSIRLAREDDAQLDKFTRSFLMLRHEAANGRSVFAATIEPYAGNPFITAVERVSTSDAALALLVRMGDRTDVIVCGAARPVSVAVGKHPATFAGAVGVLSLRGENIEHAYALGAGGWTRGELTLSSSGCQSLALHSVEGDNLVLDGSCKELPNAGEVVRLLTDDGWVYPYTVVAAEPQSNAVRMRVAEGPGLTFDAAARRLRLTAFPQREHAGAVRVEWMTGASR